MKKVILFMALVTYSAFYSQCVDPLITDFECTPPSYSFTGALTTIANPFSTGINTSTNVGQYIDDGTAAFDNLTFDNGGVIDLSTNNIFKFKVYSTNVVPLVVKLEGGTSPGVEIPLTIDVTGSWVEYTVDFSSRSAENHQKVVFFFRFNQTDGTVSDTYYIDDIRWGTSTTSSLPIVTNFETTKPAIGSYPGKLLTVSNHVSSGINTSSTIGQYTDDGTNGFDGLIFDYGSAIDLSTNNILKIKLYSTSSIQILAKLEGGSADREIWSTFSGDEGALNSWIEFTFDYSAFSNNSSGGDGNTRLVFFVNGGITTGTTSDIFYIDDVIWAPSSAWTGAVDSNWANASNWTGGVPTSTSQVTITNVGTSPVIGSASDIAAVANNLTVDGAATLTVKNGSTLIVNGIAEGNVTYTRNISTPAATGTPAVDNLEGWHLMSSPVSGQALTTTWADNNGIASGTSSNRGVATYNNAVASGNWNYFTGTATTFDQDKGYSIKRTVTGDVSFTGTLTTVDIDNIGITTNSTSFNLIGNPYLAYLNSGTLLTTNTGLLDSETLWVWNPSTKNYDAKLSGDNFQIAPGQAFFVKAGSAGDLFFGKSIQTSGSDTFLKSSVNPEITINITDGALDRYSKIRYNANATKDFDNGLDGETFSGVSNSLDVYSKLVSNNSSKKYQIQALPNSDLESMIIPVEIFSSVDRNITISAETLNLPSGYKVYIEDKSTNLFTRLDELNSKFETSIFEGENTNRFFIHTSAVVLSTETEFANQINLYTTNNSNLRVVGLNNGKVEVTIFNVLGKKVLNTLFNASISNDISLPRLSKGIYIVNIKSEHQALSKKIIIE